MSASNQYEWTAGEQRVFEVHYHHWLSKARPEGSILGAGVRDTSEPAPNLDQAPDAAVWRALKAWADALREKQEAERLRDEARFQALKDMLDERRRRLRGGL